ncbi:MAG: MCE family protein [Bacteroidetes bacterium]|nr:MCE family protein [Bacteroidota bacterium]
MNKYLKRKLWLGIIVTLSISFFIVGIFFIGRKEEIYVPTFHVNAVFENVNGLREGDFVRYAGAKVGVVDKITFVNDTTINVEMKIEKRMQQFIMKDDIAYIATEGLVGNKLLNISARKKSRQAISDGDILQTIEPFDSESIIAQLLNTSDNAAIITANLASITGKMKADKGIFESLVSDTDARADVQQIIANVKTTSVRLSDLSSHFENLTENLNVSGGVAGALFNDTSLVNELRSTMNDLQKSSAYVSEISKRFSENTIPGAPNTFSLLMNDTAFANDLHQSVTNLKTSTQKLDQNMDALKHSILLRRYFRKPEQK